MRARALVAALVLGTLLLVGAAPALAKDGDVIREGRCARASDWKLKLSEENGRIEVEYEVDQNRSGDAWRVRVRHDGDLVFGGTRRTKAPSGSFEVRLVQRDRAGNDLFTGRSVNVRTGEVCGGRAVWAT